MAQQRLIWFLACAVLGNQAVRSPFPGTIDQHPAINYATRIATDRVARARGDLKFEVTSGYLRSVLAALEIPVESQVLIFSKTGVQQAYTTPRTPRALYFSQDVYVGYIPGAPLIEVASHDPELGVVFYTLNQDARTPPVFERQERCLSCHLSSNSLDVPGLLVRSMFTSDDGRTRPQLGSFLIDHRSPLDNRWGGWYVTGTHGAMKHMGQAMNTTALDPGVDSSFYPAATSDIPALLVFDHQGRMINLITRLGWETRIAEDETRLDFSQGELRDLVSEFVDYLLFVDEAPLTSPVQGVSGFAKIFAATGPRDRQGRSLRDLDLNTRLLRYPCSYMIYSAAFDGMPEAARAAVYQRMREVLQQKPPEDRIAITEILAETKPGFSRP
ncbi:MAG: hypothetical protein ABI665_18335 [Vicinamibacterales bacterium]